LKQSMSVAYIDGASRGNPGHAAIGVLITEGGAVVCERSLYLGMATNNVAEYSALLEAFAVLRQMGRRRVEIRSDSELLVRQMNGIYKVKAEGLKPLFINAVRMRNEFDECCITHIPRAENAEADKLANKALDEALKRHESEPASK